MEFFCWNCSNKLINVTGRISFREVCTTCLCYLHCCKNCINYQVGRPNDCKIPGTEPIADREARNNCEDFVMLGKSPPPRIDPNEVSKRLFGED